MSFWYPALGNGENMNLAGQRVLIFGGTGSLGKAMIRRLALHNELAIFSRDEAKHWTIKNKLPVDTDVSFYVGDIRDMNRVREVCRKVSPSVIVIASALKQVDTCELSPYESIQTNTLGIRNVCEVTVDIAASLPTLHTVLLVSTDKACAPTNVYGMSKALAERIVTSYRSENSKVKYIAIRYGNVLESRGSIIPLFKHQIEVRTPLTVTDIRMTRFIMTLDQSVNLIEHSIHHAEEGQIWIPKIPAMNIIDLAKIFATRFDSTIQITGMRPGEKLHEDLISYPESIRARELSNHFVLEPPWTAEIQNGELFEYKSNRDLLVESDLENYLDSLGVFEMRLDDFLGHEIDEIRRG